jgi:hypothetical protein
MPNKMAFYLKKITVYRNVVCRHQVTTIKLQRAPGAPYIIRIKLKTHHQTGFAHSGHITTKSRATAVTGARGAPYGLGNKAFIGIEVADRVESRGLRPVTLPHHRTCGFPHPAIRYIGLSESL